MEEFYKKIKEDKETISKNIMDMFIYKGCGGRSKKGGIHTEKYKRLIGILMDQGMEEGMAHATAMKKLGKKKSLKEEHIQED